MNKTIHYIWLGGKAKPKVIIECIQSWKKCLPDWEIKEWNESNVNLDICPYCRNAYEAGKYAFAADVLRFDILYREGGLYFDTDVKVIKGFNDLTERYEAFSGYEEKYVNPGLVLFAKNPGDEIIKKTLDVYSVEHFVQDGTRPAKIVCEYFSEILEQYGFQYEDKLQQRGNFTILPSDYFCPADGYGNLVRLTENTRSIHLYAGSWLPWKKRVINEFKRFAYRKFGMNRIQAIMKVLKYR